MNTNRKGEETGGTNNNVCSASASADIVINKSKVCVQSGLKYNNLCGNLCLEIIHYITLHYIGSQDNNNFNLFRKDWDAVPLVRLLGKRFHS